MRLIVVAGTVQRAKLFAAELGYELGRGDTTWLCDPDLTGIRGICADVAVIDESAWPIGESELNDLHAAVRNGRVYRMERVLAKGQRP